MGGLTAIPPTSGFLPNDRFFPLFVQIVSLVDTFTFAPDT
jgi:hypothetical protein